MTGRRTAQFVTIVIAGLVCARAWSEDDPAKALEARIAAQRAASETNSAVNNARTPEERKAANDKARKAAEAVNQKQNLADLKQKTLDNLATIKETFAKAEESWKNQKYAEAGQGYTSVAMATVAGAEEMVETSRGRLQEMEDLAKTHLKGADDNDLKRDYAKEVEELALVVREFGLTQSLETARRRMINLKSRPEVAGIVALEGAAALETDGKLEEAIKVYKDIATNARYENSAAALSARRKLEELDKNPDTHAKIKAAADAKADKEGPMWLRRAQNFVLNGKPKEAIAQLQQIIEKFPDSKYAEEAKKQIEELK
ncbi:MAG: hypothetical protein ABSE73_08850 [Planctomycetota bacterium]